MNSISLLFDIYRYIISPWCVTIVEYRHILHPNTLKQFDGWKSKEGWRIAVVKTKKSSFFKIFLCFFSSYDILDKDAAQKHTEKQARTLRLLSHSLLATNNYQRAFQCAQLSCEVGANRSSIIMKYWFLKICLRVCWTFWPLHSFFFPPFGIHSDGRESSSALFVGQASLLGRTEGHGTTLSRKIAATPWNKYARIVRTTNKMGPKRSKSDVAGDWRWWW